MHMYIYLLSQSRCVGASIGVSVGVYVHVRVCACCTYVAVLWVLSVHVHNIMTAHNLSICNSMGSSEIQD